MIFALPLGLVILAAAYLATPQAYRPFPSSRGIASYPVRISLVDVEAATTRVELAALREQALKGQSVKPSKQQEEPVKPAARPALAAGKAEPATAFAPIQLAQPLVEPLAEPSATSSTAYSQNAVTSSGQKLPFYTGSFDLRAQPEKAGAVDLKIPVQDGKRMAGKVAIRITANSSLYVSRTDIARVLPDRAGQIAGLRGKYVLMSTLRARGLDLRYDAVHDRLDVAN